MKKTLFTGVCTALVTPFLNNQVNYPMLQQLLRRQMDAGIEAVVICGTTGEAPTLTDEEKLNLFRCAKNYVGDRMKIIAGTGSNNTEHTIELSMEAEQIGVDGLLIVSPYYNKATAEGLYAHYMAVASCVKLPIIIYNVPSRTGLDIPISVYQKLSLLPNIAGVKEASSDITKITKIWSACGNNLPVWTGNDEMITPAMALGASGVISVVSNLIPAETQELARAALSSDFATASALQLEFQPLLESLFSEVNPIPIKEAMIIAGFDCGTCRLPLTPISESNRKRLVQLLT